MDDRGGGTLFVLDSVQAARAMLGAGAAQGDRTVLSTHYSVVEFLRDRGVECTDCSDHFDVARARAAISQAAAELQASLGTLDSGLAPQVCAAAGLPDMQLFYALFKYPWEYLLAGLILFREVLDGHLARGRFTAVRYFYEPTLTHHPVFSFVDAAARLCEARGVQFHAEETKSTLRALRREAHSLGLLLGIAARNPGKLLRALRARFARSSSARRSDVLSGKPLALVFEPPGQFAAALEARGMQVLVIPRHGIQQVAGVPLEPALAALGKAREAATRWLRQASDRQQPLLLRSIVAHFLDGLDQLLLPTIYLAMLARGRDIRIAAWNSPLIVEMAPNLALEYLLQTGVKVLGRQHGACYFDQDMGAKHFDSDFNRCTHFLSYAATREEFALTYPRAVTRCVFVPAGRAEVQPADSASVVDIAFPISNCISLATFGRMEADLARRQRLALQAVDARRDLRCVVKPMLQYDEDNFSQSRLLGRLRHARIVRCTWTEFLRNYRPRLAIVEMISTPLYEMLHLDVDIFLMQCEVAPLSDSAMRALAKRVHIFGDPETMCAAIAAYRPGQAGALRDDEFLRRYVNRGSFEAALEAAGV